MSAKIVITCDRCGATFSSKEENTVDATKEAALHGWTYGITGPLMRDYCPKCSGQSGKKGDGK